ncbi:glycosyltransferase family 2 protein [Aurantiacibacter sp. MUD61]|uniref:glycosyltransferase family 2 protein n=1 Tax=Aurantiacibacter sp. MUD61 TaxID=3009083 RepID=UPI0022F05241|nr:glycosyltransferase family 2 protein [Aurantiacibacter sp. MUD61]
MTANSDILPVTVAVPVKNEEANLAKCLERLGRFAEIVVIDSGSSDRTTEIAHEFGARVVDFQWDGKFPKKRNWFLMNDPPQQDWVLFLDADEFIDDAFCDELARTLPNTGKSGFWIQYDNYFLGKQMKHGLAQRKLALLRTGKALFERIDEDGWSTLDMEIHEHPIVEGEVGEITARIDHRDFKPLDTFIAKHLEYAKWEARRYALVEQDSELWERFTPRQQFKYRHLAKWWYPAFYFLFTYVAKGGFLDGGTGFHYAAYKTWYFHTIRLLIRQQQSA